ncbi:hypothetical protein ZIOFF_006178 [Zingiber officinale]|uniref:Uncharacterized protein n=1 Tax=Zingiber officinale TaxID=94328 RepID=A0A8J5HNE5_ZINOF|nr:hypothetical protein ZIOFF_006178 [Zingiber officinale]
MQRFNRSLNHLNHPLPSVLKSPFKLLDGPKSSTARNSAIGKAGAGRLGPFRFALKPEDMGLYCLVAKLQVDTIVLVDRITLEWRLLYGRIIKIVVILLEKSDPGLAVEYEQISEAYDYLNVPFDLSKVIFVATAKRIQPIPPPLLDRMKVIEFLGYTPEEKLKIALKHLTPRVLEQHGISSQFLQIP